MFRAWVSVRVSSPTASCRAGTMQTKLERVENESSSADRLDALLTCLIVGYTETQQVQDPVTYQDVDGIGRLRTYVV